MVLRLQTAQQSFRIAEATKQPKQQNAEATTKLKQQTNRSSKATEVTQNIELRTDEVPALLLRMCVQYLECSRTAVNSQNSSFRAM
jgi:DNA-directed RNA polymerase specialized sigma subunit